MRIVSWNVNSLRVRLDQVERFLREQQPDVLALQETKSQDPEFPAEVFERLDALEQLEAFAAHFGPDFYRLPRNTDTITLRKQDWEVPARLPLGEDSLVPLRAGEAITWQVVGNGA